ncbi:MAG: branched-chain amino acid transport system ATP-binding protein livF [Acidimicrobiaceae bacterium]|jgi:ABC-type branched-subunit amino acid transport system ATPase component/MFS family permease
MTRASAPELGALRRAEAAIAEMEDEALHLQRAGRGAVGVVGRFELGPMSEALHASSLSWYPLFAVSVLGGVEWLMAVALTNTNDSISLTLGIPNLWLLLYLRVAGLAASGLVALRIVRMGAHRSRLALAGGVLAIAALLSTSVSRNAWALVVAALLASFGSGMAHATHGPLLFDHYRPEVRVRALVAYTAGVMSAAAVVSVLIPVADAAGLTWRSVFVVVAAVAAVAVAACARLTEPVAGCWETRVISDLVHRRLGPDGPSTDDDSVLDVTLTDIQRLRQVLRAPAARPLLFAASAFGVFLVSVPPYLATFWRDHWRMGPDARMGVYAGLCLVSVGGLVWFGRRGELAFRASPARMLRLAGRATCLGAVCLPLAVATDWFAAMLLLLAVAFAVLVVLLPAASVALLSVVLPANRPHASLALGFAVVQGALIGNFVIQAFAARYGLTWAFLAVALLVLGAGRAATRVARAVEDDLDETVGAMLEERERRTRVSQGQHLPLLGVRRVAFSYGPVQVLFDVNFTVDDGEMVALLGTNGAGKSTLLRLISGISLPSRGSVHFRGSDITHVGPDERVRVGISQVPGGRAVFGSMTVAENLRVYGHTHGRNRRAVEAGVDAGLAAFPSLAARAGNLAATLSGGEQQMLGIAKAFVVRPRVLLIDELSLGLAPIVVGELLDTVRRLNAEGTAVVVVEQSVNIALALVDHAYFMEKGEIRFDGRADELAARPDLLRSVFLEGASKAMAGGRAG